MKKLLNKYTHCLATFLFVIIPVASFVILLILFIHAAYVEPYAHTLREGDVLTPFQGWVVMIGVLLFVIVGAAIMFAYLTKTRGEK